MQRLRVAVVGVGHLGKEHARILSQLPDVELVGVADPRNVQAAAVAQRCGTRPFTDYRELLPLIDAAVIAAPTVHHHSIARPFLERGLPVLIEKPIAPTAVQADDLVRLAARQGTLIQVGHIERFNPAFEELQRRPVQPKFISCQRYGGFSGRSTDVGVVLDLMIHDLDLVLSMVPGPVQSVTALGVAVLGGNEDIAQATVTFKTGCVAQFSASRVNPAPVRQMHVWAPEGVIAIDFARRHLTLTQPNRKALHGAMDSRKMDAAGLESVRQDLYGHYLQTCELDCQAGDQLTAELKHFLHCVRTGNQPRVDGAAGRNAVALAARILESLRQHAWEGTAAGSCGPSNLPAPLGSLFGVADSQAA